MKKSLSQYARYMQIAALISFSLFLISVLMPWHGFLGMKELDGSEILKHPCAIGLISSAFFIAASLISFFGKGGIYLKILNIAPPVMLLISAYKFYMRFNGEILFGFYSGCAFLLLTLLISVAGIIINLIQPESEK